MNEIYKNIFEITSDCRISPNFPKRASLNVIRNYGDSEKKKFCHLEVI